MQRVDAGGPGGIELRGRNPFDAAAVAEADGVSGGGDEVVVERADQGQVGDVGSATCAPLGEVVDLGPRGGSIAARPSAAAVTGVEGQPLSGGGQAGNAGEVEGLTAAVEDCEHQVRPDGQPQGVREGQLDAGRRAGGGPVGVRRPPSQTTQPASCAGSDRAWWCGFRLGGAGGHRGFELVEGHGDDHRRGQPPVVGQGAGGEELGAQSRQGVVVPLARPPWVRYVPLSRRAGQGRDGRIEQGPARRGEQTPNGAHAVGTLPADGEVAAAFPISIIGEGAVGIEVGGQPFRDPTELQRRQVPGVVGQGQLGCVNNLGVQRPGQGVHRPRDDGGVALRQRAVGLGGGGRGMGGFLGAAGDGPPGPEVSGRPHPRSGVVQVEV